MRAVALADPAVQAKVAKSFIPLKVAILPGSKEVPLDWPALKGWRGVYEKMGGETCEGFTCCSTISPDLQTEYGNTGSAMVWEMFDSIAYDAEKFVAMLDRSLTRAQHIQEIESDTTISQKDRAIKLDDYQAQVRREIRREGRFRLPPAGFSSDGAIELFKLTGDLPSEN